MKKGQLSIETIIIVILALLVLVIVAASFTGGMKALWDKIVGTTEIDVASATERCNSICASAGTDAAVIKSTFCATSVVIKDVGVKNCRDLVPASSCASSC